MFARLLLLFLIVPLLELYLLVQLARATNLLTTVALVVLTGILGAALTRRQGLSAWRRIQQDLAEGRLPAGSLLEGVLILVAGLLLITPGLLTDSAGFLLLVPPLRARLARRVMAWLRKRVDVRLQTFGGPLRPDQPSDDTVIDVEFTRRPADRDRVESDGED